MKKKLAANDYIDWIILLMKTIWPQGVVCPYPRAIYIYKVKLYVWMGKTVLKSFNGEKLAAKDYIDWIILLMKKMTSGVCLPLSSAVYIYV